MATEMSWISLLANSRSRSTSQVLSTLPRRGSTAWVSLLRPILALPPAESPSTRKTSFRLRSRSEEHTSELQSPCNLVCRLLLEKKKIKALDIPTDTVLFMIETVENKDIAIVTPYRVGRHRVEIRNRLSCVLIGNRRPIVHGLCM